MILLLEDNEVSENPFSEKRIPILALSSSVACYAYCYARCNIINMQESILNIKRQQ